MLPLEIEKIIHDYRVQFEKVDTDIQTAIHSYHTTENRASLLLKEVEHMNLCPHIFLNLKLGLHQTVCECSRIVSQILDDEEVHVVQMEMLIALNNSIIYDVFNVMLKCDVEANPYML